MSILDEMSPSQFEEFQKVLKDVDVSDIGKRFLNASNGLENLRIVANLFLPRSIENRAKLAALVMQGYVSDDFRTTVAATAWAWAESAFAHIKVDDTLAASLMFSDVDPLYASEVTHPWTCYAISVPPLFGPKSPTHVVAYDLSKYVRSSKRVFGLTTFFRSSNGLVQYEACVGSFSDLLLADKYVVVGDKSQKDGLLLQQEKRLLINLIVGVCIEMSRNENRSAVECIGSMRNSVIPPQYRKDVPFVLGRSVKVDVRDAVRAYAEGKQTSGHGVRTLVRGHHKRQPCGFKSMERKWIHVEPYWRGPEDAPVIVRSHVLGANGIGV